MHGARVRPALAMVFVALALAACGAVFGTGPQRVACPGVAVLHEAQSITQFKPGPGRDLIDVRFEGEIGEVGVSCSYDDGTVDMILDFQLRASRGPAAESRSAEFEYFVAVIERGDHILAKETFASRIDFPANVNRAAVLEELGPRVPIKAGTTSLDYSILIGFQLSPEELEYNRLKLGR